jgi:hypothetical protein
VPGISFPPITSCGAPLGESLWNVYVSVVARLCAVAPDCPAMEGEMFSRVFAMGLSAIVFAAPVVAQDVNFTLVNASGVDMVELYARAVGAADWEENILGGGSLPSGSDGTVSIAGAGACDFELKMVFADGDALEDRANLCTNPSYTIN